MDYGERDKVLPILTSKSVEMTSSTLSDNLFCERWVGKGIFCLFLMRASFRSNLWTFEDEEDGDG